MLKALEGLGVTVQWVNRGDVRFLRGPVKRGSNSDGHVVPSIEVPAGSKGTFLVLYRDFAWDGPHKREVILAAWLKETHTWTTTVLPVAFFSGLYPQYNLRVDGASERLLATAKKLARTPNGKQVSRISDAVKVPEFLTNAVGIMTVIRKLKDRNELLKFMNGHSKRTVWPSPKNVLLMLCERSDPFTLKAIDDKVRVLESKDGKKALWPVWAFSHRVLKVIKLKTEPLGLLPPVYNDFIPYPSTSPDMTNEEAFQEEVKRWKKRMRQYSDLPDDDEDDAASESEDLTAVVPDRVREYFKSLGPLRAGEPGVTTVIEVDYVKLVTDTVEEKKHFNLSLVRKLVVNFLIAKAEEDNAPWWRALLDTMPQDHRKIEEWAAKLEATLDEQDERKRRDANFDPKNLPPCIHVAVPNLTNARRVVMAKIYKAIKRDNEALADVFADWLLEQVAKGENGKQRRKELKTAFNSRRLGPNTLPCKMMTLQKKGCFSCPLGGNTVRCALKRDIVHFPDQTVSDVILRSAEQQMRMMQVADLVEQSQSHFPEDATSCDITYDEDTGRPVSVEPIKRKASVADLGSTMQSIQEGVSAQTDLPKKHRF